MFCERNIYVKNEYYGITKTFLYLQILCAFRRYHYIDDLLKVDIGLKSDCIPWTMYILLSFVFCLHRQLIQIQFQFLHHADLIAFSPSYGLQEGFSSVNKIHISLSDSDKLGTEWKVKNLFSFCVMY